MKSLLCCGLLTSMSLLISALLLTSGPLYGQPSKANSLESLVTSSASPTAEKPVYPGGPPYMKRAGSFAQWTMSTQTVPDKEGKEGTAQAEGNTGKAGGQPLLLKVLTVTKTGDMIRVEQVNGSSHQNWTTWAQGQLQILVWPDGIQCAEIAISPSVGGMGASNPFIFNTSVTDFPGFEWVAPGNFRTIATYADKPCLVYQESQVCSWDELGKPIGYITATACVEVDSRRPVAIQRGDELMSFEWKEPPTSALVLPPNVQSLLKERAESLRRLTIQAVKPF
ncbi:MAG: hypothetical protein ACAI35_22165 [Candidatus Methylacidiphilales bacterium]|nr:hypothetical protein [Candidatus Methylacidiphilales bacterium]